MTKSYAFKMLLAGSGGCGKTTLLDRFTTGKFTGDTKITIGCGFSVGNLKVDENVDVTLQIWDFGGEDRFRMMLPAYCLGAKGCLLFFDLKRNYTFKELDEWIEIIKSNTDDIPIILLGTKYDLLEAPAELDMKIPLINEFLEKHDIKEYLSVSSKTGFNVETAYRDLVNYILENR